MVLLGVEKKVCCNPRLKDDYLTTSLRVLSALMHPGISWAHREQHQEKPNGMNSRNSPRWHPGISAHLVWKSQKSLILQHCERFEIQFEYKTKEYWILDSFVKCMWYESSSTYNSIVTGNFIKRWLCDLMYRMYQVFQICISKQSLMGQDISHSYNLYFFFKLIQPSCKIFDELSAD